MLNEKRGRVENEKTSSTLDTEDEHAPSKRPKKEMGGAKTMLQPTETPPEKLANGETAVQAADEGNSSPDEFHSPLKPTDSPATSPTKKKGPRRSPRLNKNLEKKKKKRRVSFSGRAQTVFFELTSPPVYHTTPRNPLQSPPTTPRTAAAVVAGEGVVLKSATAKGGSSSSSSSSSSSYSYNSENDENHMPKSLNFDSMQIPSVSKENDSTICDESTMSPVLKPPSQAKSPVLKPPPPISVTPLVPCEITQISLAPTPMVLSMALPSSLPSSATSSTSTTPLVTTSSPSPSCSTTDVNRTDPRDKVYSLPPLYEVAAHNVREQFEFNGIEDVKKELKFFLSIKTKNTKLELEQRGARIFNLDELEKNVSCDGEVGVRTLIDESDIGDLSSWRKGTLINKLANYYTPQSLGVLKKTELVGLLERKHQDDMKEARCLMYQKLIGELQVRGLSLMGDHNERIQRLRESIRCEQMVHATEEKWFADALSSIDTEEDKKGLYIRLYKERYNAFQENLSLYKLQDNDDVQFPEKKEIEVVERFVKTSGYRLELYKLIRDKSKLNFSTMDPSTMTLRELEEEMTKRRVEIPKRFLESKTFEEIWCERVNRLNVVLMEEIGKGPMKYDFGSQTFAPSDLDVLAQGQLMFELEKFGLKKSEMNSMTQGTLVKKLKQILVSRAKKMLVEVAEQELEAFLEKHPQQDTEKRNLRLRTEDHKVKPTDDTAFLEMFKQLEKESLNIVEI